MQKIKNKAREEEMREQFRSFDLDGDGSISRSEFRKVMAYFGTQITEEEMNIIMNKYDGDDNGRIDYKEFCEMMQ